jgi:dihydropteroate synthase
MTPEHDHEPRARVVQWPAPASNGAGIYGVRLRALSDADLPAAEQAARRIGLWVQRLDTDLLVQGPAALFAALPRSAMSAACATALVGALRRFRRGRRALQAGSRVLDLRRPLIVGVLNATPDSFYDRGRYFGLRAALARADEMAAEGADLIEVGGETARPDPPPVPIQEEIRRVVPLVRALAERLPLPVAVDTYKPDVAQRAVEAGAVLINDISGLADMRMAEIAAASGAALVVMHIRGRPKVRQAHLRYDSVVDEVYEFLEARTEAARRAGVPAGCLVVDPGFSFGKTPQHDLEILGRLGEFRGMGYPIYLATSRKNYIRDLMALPVEELLAGTAAAVAYGLAQGVHLVRTHDVRFMARLVSMLTMILRSGKGAAARAGQAPAMEVMARDGG